MKQSIYVLICFFILIPRCAPMKDPGSTANMRYREHLKDFDLNQEIPVEDLHEDIDFLINTIEEVHPNPYFMYGKDAFYEKLDSVRSLINQPYTRKEFALVLRPLIALLQTDHTSVKLPWEEYTDYEKKGGRIFPFEVSIEKDAIVITRNYASVNIDGDCRIQSINGVRSKDIINDLQRLYEVHEIERYFPFLLWIRYGFESPFVIESNNDTLSVDGLTSDELSEIKEQKYGQTSDYIRYKYENLGNKTGLLTVNSFGGDSRRYNEFIKDSFTQIKNDSISDLIIDIRMNDGGNTGFVCKFIEHIWDKPYKPASRFERKRSEQFDTKLNETFAWYVKPILRIHPYMKDYYKTPLGQVATTTFDEIEPEENALRYDGNVYVLIGPYTYSSAHEFAYIIKDYRMGTLIGQETGSRKRGADAYEFILPHSRLWARSATGFSIRPSGILANRGVLPDYEIQPTNEDISQGIDTVLLFTKKMVENNRTGEKTR